MLFVFTNSCTVGTSVYSDCSSGPRFFETSSCLFCCRSTSTALLRAAVNNQADGFCGRPFIFQVLNAFSKVSCTTSSASCRFWRPNSLVSTATSFPHSLRKRCSTVCCMWKELSSAIFLPHPQFPSPPGEGNWKIGLNFFKTAYPFSVSALQLQFRRFHNQDSHRIKQRLHCNRLHL